VHSPGHCQPAPAEGGTLARLRFRFNSFVFLIEFVMQSVTLVTARCDAHNAADMRQAGAGGIP